MRSACKLHDRSHVHSPLVSQRQFTKVMDNDPAILALLAAFAQDVEEGAQLMEMDAQEAQEEEAAPEIEEMSDPDLG